MSSSLVSVCMIVRNEAATLERSLVSVIDWADEVIVVDTGSTDGSSELAASLGVRVEHFEWKGDFSEARNFAQDLAKSEWIFTPDGDEWLEPKGAGNILRELLANAPDHADKVLIENRTVRNGEVLATILADRLYRNGRGLRWKYRVHEVLETAASRTVVTHRVWLHHEPWAKRGADGTISEERQAMYLAGLNRDMEQYPDDPRPVFYYASTLYGAGRYGEALEAYERYFKMEESEPSSRRAVTYRDASRVARFLGRSDRAKDFLFHSIRRDWREAESYLDLAEFSREESDWKQADHWLRICEMLWEQEASASEDVRERARALRTWLAETARSGDSRESASTSEREPRTGQRRRSAKIGGQRARSAGGRRRQAKRRGRRR